MNLLGRNPDPTQTAADRVDHPRRPAHEHVAIEHVGNEPEDRGDTELIGLVVTDLRAEQPRRAPISAISSRKITSSADTAR